MVPTFSQHEETPGISAAGIPVQEIAYVGEQPVIAENSQEQKDVEQPIIVENPGVQPIIEQNAGEQPIILQNAGEQPIIEQNAGKQPIIIENVEGQKDGEHHVIEHIVSEYSNLKIVEDNA